LEVINLIKRDTEKYHSLAHSVFDHMNIYDLQGLTINSTKQFSAAIESFELDKDETFSLEGAFPFKELEAKYILAQKLNIPLYIITYQKGTDYFTIHQVAYDIEVSAFFINEAFSMSFPDFSSWWAHLKGTTQTKQLFEAQPRTRMIDEVLEGYGLSWGGNVDGFILSKDDNQKILGIVERRVSSNYPVKDYDPANFFFYRGGDYNTWLPLVTLSQQLNCPLFLMTFNSNDDTHFGIAVVDNINGGLRYKSGPPNQNIFKNIKEAKRWMSRYMNI
jgi:hypothetical protein